MYARPRRLSLALALAGLLTVATMSWMNFELDSDVKGMLVAPSLVWAVGLAEARFEGDGDGQGVEGESNGQRQDRVRVPRRILRRPFRAVRDRRLGRAA